MEFIRKRMRTAEFSRSLNLVEMQATGKKVNNILNTRGRDVMENVEGGMIKSQTQVTNLYFISYSLIIDKGKVWICILIFIKKLNSPQICHQNTN